MGATRATITTSSSRTGYVKTESEVHRMLESGNETERVAAGITMSLWAAWCVMWAIIWVAVAGAGGIIPAIISLCVIPAPLMRNKKRVRVTEVTTTTK